MNKQKSFLMYFIEMVEQYRADRQPNSPQDSGPQPGRLRRFLRWMTPNGGTLLWVQLPPLVDGLKVYQKALDHRIAIIPGVVCSNSGQFQNFLQISCGTPYTAKVENGIATLGRIISKLSGYKSTNRL